MADAQGMNFAALQARYAAGATPQDIVHEVYQRIAEAADPGIFLHLRTVEQVLAEAAALPPRSANQPLWGIPFAIKDNIDFAGAPTTAACPAYGYSPGADAFVVAELRAAGALPIGKTNLDQFATGLVGVRTPYDVPRNAVDPAIVPGGSSSGSAVAVARGIVSFALGTDTAGSGRVPAALNNIVGLKPSLGALSASGVVPACRTLDTISIFALTVEDAYAAYQVACTYDAADAYARRMPAPALSAPPGGLTIGVPDAATREFFGDTAQAAAYEAAISRLQNMNFTVQELDFTPFFEVAKMLYEGAWVGERMTVIEDLLRESPDDVHPVTRQIVQAADRLSAADTFRGIYRLAHLKRVAEPALDGVDILCVPTIPRFYSVQDLADDPVTPNARLGTYTNFVNLMDMCGIAVPTGLRSDGRPASVTLLAAAGRDALVAGVAHGLHQAAQAEMGATGVAVPAHALPVGLPGPGEMVIAAVGAHMAGLPLNHQLTQLGARFLQAAQTAPEYRLLALAGGPPHRPGLIHAPEDGTRIALELWALPSENVGQFLAQIPAPLALGKVALDDGRVVTGFVAEAMAQSGARDISRYGGWRAYLAETAS